VSAGVASGLPLQSVELSPIGPTASLHAAQMRNDFSHSSHSSCKMRLISRGRPHLVNCQRPTHLFFV
jgi:hypothetical protein